MRRINPAVKFVGLIVVTFVLAWRFHPVLNFAVFLLSAVLILACGTKPKLFFGWMMPVLLLAVGLFFTGYRFSASDAMPVNAADYMISSSRLWNGLAQASRALAYAGVGFLFTMTTDRIDLIQSFHHQFHLPQLFTYGLLAAWGIVPQMMLEYKRTRLAFAARGIYVLPFSPRLLRPLLVKSIRWSEELAIAMESKGFESSCRRTCLNPVRVHAKDWIFLAVCAAAFPAAAFLFF